MACLPQAGFVPKYAQKLNAHAGISAVGGKSGRRCNSCQECSTGLLGAFSMLGGL